MKIYIIKPTTILTWGVIILMFIQSTYAHSGRGDFRTNYQDKIIEFMDKNQIPGLALAIVQAPYITRIEGYGLADINKKTLVASHTIFNVGQMTNAFTAVAIMQLLEEGKLSLNDLISKYISNLPQAWSKLTINHLMTHSSGLPNYVDSAGFKYDKNYSQNDIINLIKDQALEFEPGSQTKNSSSNAYLLGMVVEKASGIPYEQYVTKNQFERLGLKHTFFIPALSQVKSEINDADFTKHSQFLQQVDLINPTEIATGYAEKDGKLVAQPIMNYSGSYANSSIFASAEDISFWDIGLAGNILVKDPKNRDFLYHGVALTGGQSSPGNVGWLFPGRAGLMEIKGNTPGYSAFLSRFTAASDLLCVTLLVNKEGVADLDILAREIASAFDAKLAVPNSSAWTKTLQSPYSVRKTIDRVASVIKKQGGTVFARIDHSEEAKKARQKLLDTEVIIFGNPAKGTKLMQDNPAMAIDLPLKMMARKDESGQVWLSFTDPLSLAKEYGAKDQQSKYLLAMSNALRKLAEQAISSDFIP